MQSFILHLWLLLSAFRFIVTFNRSIQSQVFPINISFIHFLLFIIFFNFFLLLFLSFLRLQLLLINSELSLLNALKIAFNYFFVNFFLHLFSLILFLCFFFDFFCLFFSLLNSEHFKNSAQISLKTPTSHFSLTSNYLIFDLVKFMPNPKGFQGTSASVSQLANWRLSSCLAGPRVVWLT